MSIDIGKMITDAQDEFSGIFIYLGVQIALLKVTLQDLCRGVISNIVFVECLQCDHSRLSAYPWHGTLKWFLMFSIFSTRRKSQSVLSILVEEKHTDENRKG